MSHESAFIDALIKAFPTVESRAVEYEAESISVMLEDDVEILINKDDATANGPGAGAGWTVEVFNPDGGKIATRSAISPVDAVDIAKRHLVAAGRA